MNPPVTSAEAITGTVGRLLDRGYVDVAQRTLGAIASSTTDRNGIIQVRLGELEAEVERLRSDEIYQLPPDNPVLRALLSDLDSVMRRNQSRVDASGDDVQGAAVDVSGTLTRQLALPGLSDDQVRIVTGADWSSADPEVVQRLVQYVDTPAWADELAQYGPRIVKTVENQALFGISQGWSSVKAAREIRRVTEGLPTSVANTLMRTLYMQSYRSGTAIHQNANVQLIKRVIRIETLDGQICIACIYQHGEVIWDGVRDAGQPIQPIQEHHSGRGTTMTEVHGMTRNVTRGEDWFGTLSTGRQRALMRNDSAYRAYQAGAVQLQDFVKPYDDPVFGPMVRQASLKDMLGDGAKAWYQ